MFKSTSINVWIRRGGGGKGGSLVYSKNKNVILRKKKEKEFRIVYINVTVNQCTFRTYNNSIYTITEMCRHHYKNLNKTETSQEWLKWFDLTLKNYMNYNIWVWVSIGCRVRWVLVWVPRRYRCIFIEWSYFNGKCMSHKSLRHCIHWD